MGSIQLVGVAVVRGGEALLRDVDLQVGDGEVMTLLGRSGSGKTSLLRVVAGHDEVAAGQVLLGGRDVTRLPPRERGLGMVAQGAPLHPTLDVEGNLRLPFELRGANREEGRNRAWGEALRFGLRRLLGRYPRQLSAGQRATAATARAVVGGPGALLLDEPAAHLDQQSRARVLQQVGIVQRTRGTTVLLATNTLAVARTVGHRVAVIDNRTVAQVGPLTALRVSPATLDVADLVHEAPLARLEGRVWRGGGGSQAQVVTGAGAVGTWNRRVAGHDGPVVLALPQSALVLVPPEDGELTGTVRRVATTGPTRLVTVDTAGGPVIVATRAATVPAVEAPVGIEVRRALVATASGEVLAVIDRG